VRDIGTSEAAGSLSRASGRVTQPAVVMTSDERRKEISDLMRMKGKFPTVAPTRVRLTGPVRRPARLTSDVHSVYLVH